MTATTDTSANFAGYDEYGNELYYGDAQNEDDTDGENSTNVTSHFLGIVTSCFGKKETIGHVNRSRGNSYARTYHLIG